MMISPFSLYILAQEEAGQFIIPEVAKQGDNGFITSELIYPLENRPTPECHASTIVETSEGMLAAWFGGTHEKHKDVGIWVSSRIPDLDTFRVLPIP